MLAHCAVAAFKKRPVIPQQVGKEVGATIVLFGKLNTRPTGIAIGVELVDAQQAGNSGAKASTRKHKPSRN